MLKPGKDRTILAAGRSGWCLVSLIGVLTLALVFSLTAVAWALGELTQKPGKAGCISETGSDGTCQDGRALHFAARIAISPDGKNAYVTGDSGTFTQTGTVAIFDRDPETGELSQKEGEGGCVSEDGTDDDGGPCKQARELVLPRAVVVSPDGKNVYVASAVSDAVTIFDRDPNTGELTQKAGLAGCISETGSNGTCQDGRVLDDTQNLTVSPDGRSVYASSFNSNGVAIFDRDPTTGELTQKEGKAGCVTEDGTDKTGGACQDGKALGFAGPIATSPDGKNVYVATEERAALAVFDRDPNTGELTQKPGAAGCIAEANGDRTCQDGKALVHPNAIAVSPDGESVYASSFSGTTTPGAVAIFDRNLDTGELAQKGGEAGCITEGGSGGTCQDGRALFLALGIAVSPDGEGVYLASAEAGLAIFDRSQENGELTQKAGPAGCITKTGNQGACQTGPFQGSSDTVVSPDGKNVYVLADGVEIFDRSLLAPPPPPPPPFPPPPPTDTEAPTVSGFKFVPTRFVAKAKPGARIRFTLSEPAKISLVLERVRAGRRVGRRFLRVGTLHFADRPAGANAIPFNGRIGGRALPAAHYRASITATDAAGNRSALQRASFTVVAAR